ncbi:MAG: hypothetical protein Q4D57_06535 [Clostridia bacterium]|nr:hypothetical protein [Clostridia bacterium]
MRSSIARSSAVCGAPLVGLAFVLSVSNKAADNAKHRVIFSF